MKQGSKVVVALSGGVDSAVAAVLLAEQGHEVVGAMLQLWVEPGAAQRDNLCCTPEAVDRARAVAEQLAIPFHLLDLRAPFRASVVEPFVSEYAAARTPNPCVLCNREIRFGLLLRWAFEQGADYLATGHYARVLQTPAGWQLLRGKDLGKDQSYVLHALTQEQLAHILFPLGELTKRRVREIARSRGLPVASQPESQDICFLVDGDYRRFVALQRPDAVRPGPIVDVSGRVLGQHTGLVNYTVGQRKGIGVAGAHPLYVLALDASGNALVVAPAEALGRAACVVAGMHSIAGREPAETFAATAQIRYHHREVPVVVTPRLQGQLDVRFARPQRDVTPGQYLVLYDGEVVLGGGVICALSETVLE